MTASKMQLFTVTAVIILGIWMAGFYKVHWLLYMPVALLVFAGVTGICPGLIFGKSLDSRRTRFNSVYH